MDFFSQACQSGPHDQPTFGLCDDQNASRAYVDIDNPATWIAIVDNPGRRPLIFTAIDKCVVKDDEASGRLRCDGMLVTDDLLYLVELKEQRAHWRSMAIEQLESTILVLHQHHAVELDLFRHKKAFACNKRNGHFKIVDHELKRRFFQLYGFRIDIQAKVSVPAY